MNARRHAREGVVQPVSHPSHRRIGYTDDCVCAACRCGDDGPLAVPSFQRDHGQRDTDFFGLLLDTYKDNENALVFLTSPAGPGPLQPLRAVPGERRRLRGPGAGAAAAGDAALDPRGGLAHRPPSAQRDRPVPPAERRPLPPVARGRAPVGDDHQHGTQLHRVRLTPHRVAPGGVPAVGDGGGPGRPHRIGYPTTPPGGAQWRCSSPVDTRQL